MPVQPTYPGVYIEELPSGVRTITGVATSITAFIGRAMRGPVNDPTRIQSMSDFARQFGGLAVDSTLSYAVQQYFLNGGADAIIVRVTAADAVAASLTYEGLILQAKSVGAWGNYVKARVDHNTRDDTDTTLFNLTLRDAKTGETEAFVNLSTETDDARYARLVLEQQSNLVNATAVPAARPDEHPDPADATKDVFHDDNAVAHTSATGGDDGGVLTDLVVTGEAANKTGIYALEKTDLFNLLCIPPLKRTIDVDPTADVDPITTLNKALIYCKKRRAMLVVDPPSAWTTAATAESSDLLDGLRDENAAVYFPRLKMPDPLKDNQIEEFTPCGAMAGIMARTDATRGVWKAPAGQDDGQIRGVRQLSVKLTDGENGRLNPLGINCLRTFPVIGNIVWGARTWEGADRLASEWKYIPVRRTALFIEESLYRGTQWAVFEPNDEPLWAQLRLNIGAFMQNLFRQGAFQGGTPKEAYLVKCDSETTTQNDINLGIVNILVGFAPLKPAEFVIIKIQQLAGQVEA